MSACRKKRHCITQTGSVSTGESKTQHIDTTTVVVLAHRRFIFQYALRPSTILPHHHGYVQCHCWIDVWHQPCVLRTKGEIFRSQFFHVCLSVHPFATEFFAHKFFLCCRVEESFVISLSTTYTTETIKFWRTGQPRNSYCRKEDVPVVGFLSRSQLRRLIPPCNLKYLAFARYK